ncbi:hypothetical protein P152DRAFT_420210, partial [Eremomyces bilateralis CBS 781.70]
MDRASQVLVDGPPESQPCTYRALSEHGKARSQQYLTPAEEKAFAQYLKRSADLGYPIPIKHVRSLAFCIASRRSTSKAATKPPNKNWPKGFEIRNPVLKARKVKAVDWNRHDNNIYDKVTHWFE